MCQDIGRNYVPGVTDIGNHCDDCVTSDVALPFTFAFYGTPYNRVNISSNVNVQFASASFQLL